MFTSKTNFLNMDLNGGGTFSLLAIFVRISLSSSRFQLKPAEEISVKVAQWNVDLWHSGWPLSKWLSQHIRLMHYKCLVLFKKVTDFSCALHSLWSLARYQTLCLRDEGVRGDFLHKGLVFPNGYKQHNLTLCSTQQTKEEANCSLLAQTKHSWELER